MIDTDCDYPIEILPKYSIDAIGEDSTSPQAKAYQILYHHPDTSDMEEWRVLELFAFLSGFYLYYERGFLDLIDDESLKEIVNNILESLADATLSFLPCQLQAALEQVGVDYIADLDAFLAPKYCSEEGRIVRIALSDWLMEGYQLYGILLKEIALLTELEVLDGRNQAGLDGTL